MENLRTSGSKTSGIPLKNLALVKGEGGSRRCRAARNMGWWEKRRERSYEEGEER